MKITIMQNQIDLISEDIYFQEIVDAIQNEKIILDIQEQIAEYLYKLELYRFKEKEQRISEQIQSDKNIIKNFISLLEDKLFINHQPKTINNQDLFTTHNFCKELISDLSNEQFIHFPKYHSNNFRKPAKEKLENYFKNLKKDYPKLKKSSYDGLVRNIDTY